MNQGIYKLVFSKVHHALVVVAEIASSRAGDGQRRARRGAMLWLALSMLPGPWMVMSAWAELPAGIQVRDGINVDGVTVIRNAANVDVTKIISSSANQITFQQLAPRAIVNYDKLNLDKGQQFNVLMDASWSMLNRVHSVDPSLLNGTVNAAGNIYFINANGIVIGKDAVFNVGSLYAGTLNIADDLFNSGFVNDSGYTSVFELVGTLDLDANQASRINTAEVRVESGARINANPGGKVLLFAPKVSVEKDAVIRTPDGQTILAAGKKVYLKSSQDPAGMLVEVAAGGTATNLGTIVAERGNITMMGLAVNQMGKVSATTSVRANGSIRLIAQEDVQVVSGQETQIRNGIVTLGKDSVTEVTPEMGDKEEVLASLAFKPSTVDIAASLVNIDGAINVKGGNVTVSSLYDAAAALNSPVAQRIHLGEHASIDVSGVDAIAPMSRNQLEVQLNSDALKDNPILRGSALFGQKVFVDARKGTSLFDLQPYIDSTRMATVAEKMTNAGTVTLSNTQEIIVEKGARIDVSGGSTTYTAGTIKESQLVYNGKLVPISQASPGLAYQRVADTTKVVDSKWGSTKSYTLSGLATGINSYFEGGNAGEIKLVTPIEGTFVQKLVLDGTLLGATRISQQQLLSHNIPLGASLVASARNLDLERSVQQLSDNFAFGDVLDGGDDFVSRISTNFLSQGFNRIDLQNVKTLNVNTALNIAPMSTAAFNAAAALGDDTNRWLTLGRAGDTTLNINQNITAHGIDVRLNAGVTRIADNVTISTAGSFVNNKAGIAAALTQQTAENAGSIQAGIIEFGQNVTLDASAGAYVDSAGSLHTGKAGDISFITKQQLPGDVALKSYGFDHGGELSIQFGDGSVHSSLLIASENVAVGENTYQVDPQMFSQGGFSKFNLSAFNIALGTENASSAATIYGLAQTLQMQSGFASARASDSIFDVARLTTLPDYLRTAVSFNFHTLRVANDLGVLTLHENAHLMTDTGGSVKLVAGKQVNVLGDITAQGGEISLKINDRDADLPEDASQMVFIGSHARLDASGTSFRLPSSRSGLIQNQVVNAGKININLPDNVLTPEEFKGAVVIKEGALLDVSATSIQTHTLTSQGYIYETLYGDAGQINIYGFGSMLVDGTLSGHALGTGRGGSLSMLFESIAYDSINPSVNDSGRFWVTNQQQALTTAIQVGDTLKDTSVPITATSGQYQRAQISAEQIEQGGFDNVRLSSVIRDVNNANNRLLLASDLDLSIAGNLRLDSPVLQVLDNGHAVVNAGHLTLYSRKLDVDSSVLSGNGTLTLNANQIYIDGLVATSGVSKTTLHASRDIHGQGATTFIQENLVASNAGLTTQGTLELVARQVYPDSGAKLNFTALGADSQIHVRSSGLAASNVLSGGGILTLQAENIQQDGVLQAPFGQINLIGNNSVSLGRGSLTSVSGNGQNIPFGNTSSAGEIFNTDSGASRNLVEKEITIQSPHTNLGEGAQLDLSGGGELFAYEWISGGVGGTKDILAQPNTYALIPTMTADYAATDRLYNNSSVGVDIGQSIYITGVAGIPTGTYTLLPARYALVPGAFIVQRSESTLLRGQTGSLQDGSLLTTGYLADLNTGAKDAQWSTFRVIDGSILRPADGAVSKAPSQYVITNASTYFADPLKTDGVDVKSTQDAGKLVLAAQQLTLDATVTARKITGADGLAVDISASNIRVVSQVDAADTASLQLQAGKLNALNADSMLLGGIRSQVGNTTFVNTIANSVSIENDASHALKTVEFLVTALERVQMLPGARIDTGVRNSQAQTVSIVSNGDGAFFGMSSLHDIDYSRSGGSLYATSGVLSIAAGAQLAAGNMLIMDGSSSVDFAGSLTLASGANATLGSNRILIGDAPAGESGLYVSDDTLAQLDNVANLTLNSASTIDTYGNVVFGNDKLNLTLNAAGIAGHLAAGEASAPANAAVVLNTKSLTLKNTVDAGFADITDVSGRTLQINAETVRLEGDPAVMLVNHTLAAQDKTTIAGFDQLQINARNLTVAKQGALDLQVAQTDLNIGRIDAASGANFTLVTNGTLNTTQGVTAGLAANTNLGGMLRLQADQLNVNSRLEALGGQIELQAGNQLTLGSQAVVSAASGSKLFADKTVYVDAGKVKLNAGGDMVVNAGALVNVSSQGDADAGTVALSATSGHLRLEGQLDGRATGSGQGGKLEVDVNRLPVLKVIDQQAKGFSQGRNYRVRNGDVLIDGTGDQSLVARQVSVTADQGAIGVSGTINANSDKQGSIGLYASGDLSLEASAVLSANSTAAGAEGGKVALATSTGSLRLREGSSISVAGGTSGAGGTVQLRAPRTGAGAGTGVAVNQLGTSIAGAQSVVLEAFRVFHDVNTLTTGTGTGSALGYTTLVNDVNSFMSHQGSILAALGKTGDSRFHLRAGQEIRSSDTLTVDTDWNLYSDARTGAEPGVLTLRATNDLNLNGSLSDGFLTTAANAAIASGASWSYRLVAGADMQSANVMNTLPSILDGDGNSVSGNVSLAAGKLVRTGTGDIEIAAGGDLRMGNTSAVIYTAGVQAAALNSFTAPIVDQSPLYLDHGGDIQIHVRGNITGAEADDRQIINQWLFRQGGNTSLKDTSWWVRPDLFKQSLAALGGGNVTVNAGGDIANFSVSVPTTARFDNFGTNAKGDSMVNGGGDLTLTAGGNLYSGIYFIGKGEATIKVDGSITAQPDKSFGTILAMMDGKFDVSAGKDMLIEATVNPTLLPQAYTTLVAGNRNDATRSNSAPNDLSVHNSYFNTYSETAAVNFNALNGNITYATQVDSLLSRSVQTELNPSNGRLVSTTSLRNNTIGGLGFNPGTVNMLAQNGSISIGKAYLMPASRGNVSLLSEGDVQIGKLLMSDASLTDLPGINNPERSSTFNDEQLLLGSDTPYFNNHAKSLLHANDMLSAMIVSRSGSLTSNSGDAGLVVIPKAAQVVAGLDVRNLDIALQNNRNSDVSVVSAGRDVNTQSIVIAGPGELLVEAGRNIDLIYPNVSTIQATGSTGTRNDVYKFTSAYRPNTALPTNGASISMIAGIGEGANVQAYVDRYIAPTGTGPDALSGNTIALADYRKKTADALLAFMRKFMQKDDLETNQAFSLFNAQSDAVKTVFVNRHLTTELISSAEGFAKAGNHERGYEALDTLYPTKYAGDILLFNSKISTNSGGSIDMIAPGGLINVGVPGKGGNDIGIITEKGGEIRAIADGDFSVNQSKVITQYGSDIAIWSTHGTIDAGRGSKTATSIPERIVQTDAYGNTTVEVRGVASGSGIRAQTYDEDGPNGKAKAPEKGTVYLTAPVVDAGEAGIEAGNLFVVAPIVLNVGNIQVGGLASGVPLAATSSLAGISTGLSPDAVNAAARSVAQSVASSAASSAMVKPVLPSIISVDVISIGR